MTAFRRSTLLLIIFKSTPPPLLHDVWLQMNILDNDMSTELQAQVKQAISNQEPLFIHGGKSKLFYGNTVDATPLDISAHTGIINYEPTELCITVRAGTKLNELEALLAKNNQILPFEPPHYLYNDQDTATIGGAIAAGFQVLDAHLLAPFVTQYLA